MVTQRSDVVTLITGGASGIGRATALRLSARGDHVALMDRDEEGLAVTAQLVRDGGGFAELAAVDVCDGPAVHTVVDAIAQRLWDDHARSFRAKFLSIVILTRRLHDPAKAKEKPKTTTKKKSGK